MAMIAWILSSLISLFLFALIINIIGSWLVAFNVINRGNQLVDTVLRTCQNVTEPALRPIRSVVPNLGGIDISPIFVFIGLRAIQIFILAPMIVGIR
ncbi:MAG: YggT family protein [Pseudomonadota bacterium]